MLPGRLLITAIAACLAALFAGAAAPAMAKPRPNIVVVETDDQTLEMLRHDTMPNVLREIGARGITFSDFVTQSLCCPSRASFITGQYPHNDGVFSNTPGYPELIDKRDTLPVWLRRAGYRTGLVGKFLNGYESSRGAKPAPGFDEWFNLLDNRYFRTPISDNGRHKHLIGMRNRDYLTNVLTRKALAFTRQSAHSGKPFFLWLAYLAPHGARGHRPEECTHLSPVPPPADTGDFAGRPLPEPPSFNEADVSDKPSIIRSMPPLDEAAIGRISAWYHCALDSLPAVDRGVGRLVDTLRSSHVLRNTMLVFTSDNGFLYGEHRRELGKELPYEEDIHLPLLIRAPASLGGTVSPGTTVSLPVAGVDLAPTFLQLAGAEPCRRGGDCRTPDGRSLVPLLRGDTSRWPDHRGILVQLHEPRAARLHLPCSFDTIRTPFYSYSEYTQIPDPQSGVCEPANEAELYDLTADPFELGNLLYTDPQGSAAKQAALAARLDALRNCSGTKGPKGCE